MKFKIYYNIGAYLDCYEISGNNIEEIQRLNKLEMERRCLNPKKNYC